jgi:hypothetical protein
MIDWMGPRLAEEGARSTIRRVIPISPTSCSSTARFSDPCSFGLTSPRCAEFFSSQMSADAAHRERWREEIPQPDQEVISRRYEAALAQLSAEDYQCAAVLRRSYEQGAARV